MTEATTAMSSSIEPEIVNKATFSQIAAGTVNEAHRQVTSNKYVEIDTTFFCDCYSIPHISVVVDAVLNNFQHDTSKKLYPILGRDLGLFRIDTKNINLYAETDCLVHRGVKIAKVSIKTENTYINQDGKIVRERLRENDDLLVTLYQANTERFEHITDDEIHEKIVAMGIGRLKRAIKPQTFKNTDVLNGNKFFVLAHVEKSDIDKIPHSFEFWGPEVGHTRIWLNFNGKKRKCSFCSQFHDTSTCPLEEKIRKLEEERDAVKSKFENHLPSKTYGDSTLRLSSQNALASDVDAMSGGSTGNILNAIEIDKTSENIQNIILVAGQNELNRRMEPDEFIWTLKTTRERITQLAEEKKVAILPPPPQHFLDSESQAKERWKPTLPMVENILLLKRRRC